MASFSAMPRDVRDLIKLFATCSPSAAAFRHPATDADTQEIQRFFARGHLFVADRRKVRALDRRQKKLLHELYWTELVLNRSRSTEPWTALARTAFLEWLAEQAIDREEARPNTR